MRVSREKYLKREAEKYARMMRRAEIKRVRVVGKRGFWTVIGQATASQLASFASEEAHRECRK